MKQRLWIFDFDGTVTDTDTLLAFIKYACGTARFIKVFAMYSPLLVLMKLHLYPNYKAKERIFCRLFRGMTEPHFNALCASFAANSQHILRPKAVAMIKECTAKGEQVCIVSASIDNWVRPFFDDIAPKSQPPIIVMGTQPEVKEGILTGRFLTRNCYGAEKVRRVQAVFKDRAKYYITAFGDSRGDKELLDYADEGHYRPFER